MIISLGVSLLINAGSNIIFGEISFVTNAAGMVLQLAVSLDYSVFLLHRFEKSRRAYPDPKEAMTDALTKSTSSILSSGLTTVIGFLALGLMRFRIGPDLGFALAKGVAISLICVFIFMPCLIMLTYRFLDSTRHRPLMPKFDKFGKAVSRIMLPMAAVFAVIIAPVYLASNANDFYYGSSHIFGEDTRLGADTAKIEDVFGKQDTYVVLVPKVSCQTEKALSEELRTLKQVKDIISYADTVGAEIPEQYLDEDTHSMLCSDNYSRMVVSVDADYEGSETFELVKEIRDICNEHYPNSFYLAGEGISTYDLMDTVTKDMVKVNLIAIGAVFVVLLLTMKSLSLPFILVLAIETAIWLNLSLPYFKATPHKACAVLP
ncbi:MAG: MMPL family transporter [Oscillospiraceae bacterium]